MSLFPVLIPVLIPVLWEGDSRFLVFDSSVFPVFLKPISKGQWFQFLKFFEVLETWTKTWIKVIPVFFEKKSSKVQSFIFEKRYFIYWLELWFHYDSSLIPVWFQKIENIFDNNFFWFSKTYFNDSIVFPFCFQQLETNPLLSGFKRKEKQSRIKMK